MIDMDKPAYQELAARILAAHRSGHTWQGAQWLALGDMRRQYGWSPS